MANNDDDSADIPQLRAEIQASRARLRDTMDAIERQFTAGGALENAARRLDASSLGDTIRRSPTATTLVGAGMAWLASGEPRRGDRARPSDAAATHTPTSSRPSAQHPDRAPAKPETASVNSSHGHDTDESAARSGATREEIQRGRHLARHQDDRGRNAHRPRDIPRKGWRDIALRIKDQLDRDNVSIVAAGVAFYALLAIFPALAAILSIYGLVADPAQVEQQLLAVSGALPEQAQAILREQLTRIAGNAGGALGFGVVIGLLLTLYSAAKGTKSLITALNIVYDEHEDRDFIKLNLIALALTLGAVVFVLLALVTVVVIPVVLNMLGLGALTEGLVTWLRWPLLALAVVGILALLYSYAPDRARPRWRWVSWGSVVATVLWILASIAFSLYVRYFGNYNETYGSLGAIIVLLMWFYLSAYVVLLGAEINAEMEHQTGRDTTTGQPHPPGQRGAYVADTVGEQP